MFFIFDNPYRPPDPVMQASRNREYMRKRAKEYLIFCKRLMKSIDSDSICIENIEDEDKTCGYSNINLLFEYTSERGFYYNLRHVITVNDLITIGNPIFHIWDRFIADCKEKDPFRMPAL